MPKGAKMVRWYSPPRLVSIGVRATISTVFGEFADRRDAIAAARPINPDNLDPVHSYAAYAANQNSGSILLPTPAMAGIRPMRWRGCWPSPNCAPENPELKPHLIETPIRLDGSSKSTSASTATQGLGGS